MARAANLSLMRRLSKVVKDLNALQLDLIAHGDHDAADAVKRASRELETVDRQGLFKARGQVL